MRSTNGGQTFSAPRRINTDPVNHNKWHWFGTLSVAPNGRIDVVCSIPAMPPINKTSQLFYSYSSDRRQYLVALTSWSATLSAPLKVIRNRTRWATTQPSFPTIPESAMSPIALPSMERKTFMPCAHHSHGGGSASGGFKRRWIHGLPALQFQHAKDSHLVSAGTRVAEHLCSVQRCHWAGRLRCADDVNIDSKPDYVLFNASTKDGGLA